MILHWPQITAICMYGLAILLAIAQDGELKKGRHSAGVTLINVMVGVWILYCGGFWTGGR